MYELYYAANHHLPGGIRDQLKVLHSSVSSHSRTLTHALSKKQVGLGGRWQAWCTFLLQGQAMDILSY